MREAGETVETDPDIARPDDDLGVQVKGAEGEAEGSAGDGKAEGKVGVKLGGGK